jgi:hypothetical protein
MHFKLCYYAPMARPTREGAKIIEGRNELIRRAIKMGFNQSQVALMFRIPRNTVYIVCKK